MNEKDDKELQKRCMDWAKRECANYYNGNCILEETACHVLNPRYPTLQEGTLDCDYFRFAVLPAFPALQEDVEILIHLPVEMEDENSLPEKHCLRCGEMFTPTSNRQQHCAFCQGKLDRENARERKRKQRRKIA